LPALKPLAATIPTPPTSPADYKLWDDKQVIEGADSTKKEIKCLDDDDEVNMGERIQALGWPRWKTVYVR
jgi:hypothetical protein